MRLSRLVAPLAILGTLSTAAVFGQPSFERDVEPIFKTNCYSCHGGTAMVGLDLRTATSVLRGSHEGPVVVKRAPEESLLYRKVSKRMMPPPAFNLKLTDAEIDTVRRWIEAGAPSDEEAIIAAKTKEETARFHELAFPIFEDRCFACHASDQPMGGLDLRTVQSVLKGSESGPVISDLGSIKSILIRKLTSGEMPPPGMGQPLGDGEIRTLARWIDTSDFRLLRPHAERTTFNAAEAPPVTEEDRQFWSFRTPEAAPVPKVKNRKRVRTPIDAFLLQRLESEDLGFSPEASKLTLLRRAWLDLIGVPPSPRDIQAYLDDKRPDAYERLIDTLLESKHYGERWGRHWLDAAGYSDVSGFDSAVDNVIVVDGMWRYRDWVIRAFNDDMPYDRFLVEQLAGDELVDWRSAETYTPEILDKLVATGYLRSVFDRTDQDVVNLVGERYDVLFHLMEKVSTGLMGLTMGCARCHSHKYDPIPQRDYYRLLSVFATGYNPVRWLQPKNHHLPSVSKREQEAIEHHNAEIDKPAAKLKERLEAIHRPYRDKLLDGKLEGLPENIRPETKEALATPEADRTEVQKFLASKFEEQLTVTPEEVVKALSEEHLASHNKLTERLKILDGYRRSWDKIQALWDLAAPPKIRSAAARRGRASGAAGPAGLPGGRQPARRDRCGPAAGDQGRDQRPPSGVRPLADTARPSPHRPGVREPGLAASLRAGHRGDPGQLRATGQASVPSRTAGLAGGGVRAAGLERQEAPQADYDLHGLPAIVRGASGRFPRAPGGSGKPALVAHEPAPAGSGDPARLHHGRQREAGLDHGGPCGRGTADGRRPEDAEPAHRFAR